MTPPTPDTPQEAWIVEICVAGREWTGPWRIELSAGWEEQAEGRLHRDGQQGAVTAYYPCVLGTIDEDFVQIIENKRANFAEVLETDEIEEHVTHLLVEAIRRRRT